MVGTTRDRKLSGWWLVTVDCAQTISNVRAIHKQRVEQTTATTTATITTTITTTTTATTTTGATAATTTTTIATTATTAATTLSMTAATTRSIAGHTGGATTPATNAQGLAWATSRTHVNTLGNPKNYEKASEYKRQNNNGGGQNIPFAPTWQANAAVQPVQQQTAFPNIPMYQPMQAAAPMYAPGGAMGHQQALALQYFANSANCNNVNMGFMGNVQPNMMGGNFMGQNF